MWIVAVTRGTCPTTLAERKFAPAYDAGVVLLADGGCQAIPGLPADVLLIPRSPVVAAARERMGDGHVYSSFLWPVGDCHASVGHVRVTVLAAPDDAPELTAVAVLSPANDVHGLTPRELEVLGLLVEGCSNQEIARTLVVTPRTVATHLEHILVKLAAPTRTLAAVRAERDGLYFPASSIARTVSVKRSLSAG